MDTINVMKRDAAVTTKQLRRAGFIPASIFGGALPQSVSIQLQEATARKMVRTRRVGSTLQLAFDGQTVPVQIKEKAVNTVTGEIQHLSFQALQANQPVNSVIHIVLKNDDIVPGMLERMTLEIPYACLPQDMIDTITLDLEGTPVGTVITLADIPALQSSKLTLQLPPDTIVVRTSEKRSLGRGAAAESTADSEA